MALSAVPTLAAVSFQSLGNVAGAISVQANSISADGTTVVGQATDGFRSFAAVWTAGTGLVEIGGLPEGSSYASGVSADGRTIVGTTQKGVTASAFRWTASGGTQLLQGLAPGRNTYGSDVSGDGSVIVGYDDQHALRWDLSGQTFAASSLPSPGIASAYAISRNGQVIVGAGTAFGPAYAWTNAALTVLPDVAGTATGVSWRASADGSTIVGSLSDGTAFRWTNSEGTQPLGPLSGDQYASARSVSDDGSIVGGESYGFLLPGSRAWIWTAELGLIDFKPLLESLGLDLSGWQLSTVAGISADGLTLTGSGLLNGVQEAWIAHIPTPGSILPVAMLAPLAARRRRSPHSVGR